MDFSGPTVSLIVGGKHFTCSKANAEKSPVLAQLLEVGDRIELDLDPKSFIHVLAHLRGYPLDATTKTVCNRVCIDAGRLGLTELESSCAEKLKNCPFDGCCGDNWSPCKSVGVDWATYCPAKQADCPTAEAWTACCRPVCEASPVESQCKAQAPLCACGEITANCTCPPSPETCLPKVKMAKRRMVAPASVAEEPMPQLKPAGRARPKTIKPGRTVPLSMPMPAPMRLRYQQELSQPSHLNTMFSQMLNGSFYEE